MEVFMSNGLDHFIQIVEGGQEKTASNNSSEVNSSLLDKLAAELGAQDAAIPAESPVTAANPAVASATDAVAVPQEVAAGAALGEKPAGEVKKPAKSDSPTISSDASDVQTANEMNKEDAAIAEDISKTSSDVQYGRQVGKEMANAFYQEMEKRSFDEQYEYSRAILDEAGLLENYNFS
jgi:hypothetical protein